eukprot:m.8041 g.8041  ORF g.8041 m.8041 type:complete len:1480 (+) comp3107_c0_seq1:327-4766(+)
MDAMTRAESVEHSTSSCATSCSHRRRHCRRHHSHHFGRHHVGTVLCLLALVLGPGPVVASLNITQGCQSVTSAGGAGVVTLTEAGTGRQFDPVVTKFVQAGTDYSIEVDTSSFPVNSTVYLQVGGQASALPGFTSCASVGDADRSYGLGIVGVGSVTFQLTASSVPLQDLSVLVEDAPPGSGSLHSAIKYKIEFSSDRSDLRTVRNSIGFDGNASWDESTDHCQWNGVTCTTVELLDRVTELDLSVFDAVPDLTGRLGALKSLELRDGIVPSFAATKLSALGLGDKASLETLAIVDSQLYGQLPVAVATAMSSVNRLDLSGNRLSGRSPDTSAMASATLLQADGFQFVCPLTEAASQDLASTDCAACGYPGVGADTTPPFPNSPAPVPAPSVGDTVNYLCISGFGTRAGANNYSLTCMASTTYTCAASAASECVCLELGCDGLGGTKAVSCAKVVVRSTLVLTGVTPADIEAASAAIKSAIAQLFAANLEIQVSDITLSSASNSSASGSQVTTVVLKVDTVQARSAAVVQTLDDAGVVNNASNTTPMFDALTPHLGSLLSADVNDVTASSGTSSSSSGGIGLGVIAGAAGGGFVLLVLLMWWCCLRGGEDSGKRGSGGSFVRQPSMMGTTARSREWKQMMRQSSVVKLSEQDVAALTFANGTLGRGMSGSISGQPLVQMVERTGGDWGVDDLHLEDNKDLLGETSDFVADGSAAKQANATTMLQLPGAVAGSSGDGHDGGRTSDDDEDAALGFEYITTEPMPSSPTTTVELGGATTEAYTDDGFGFGFGVGSLSPSDPPVPATASAAVSAVLAAAAATPSSGSSSPVAPFGFAGGSPSPSVVDSPALPNKVLAGASSEHQFERIPSDGFGFDSGKSSPTTPTRPAAMSFGGASPSTSSTDLHRPTAASPLGKLEDPPWLARPPGQPPTQPPSWARRPSDTDTASGSSGDGTVARSGSGSLTAGSLSHKRPAPATPTSALAPATPTPTSAPATPTPASAPAPAPLPVRSAGIAVHEPEQYGNQEVVDATEAAKPVLVHPRTWSSIEVLSWLKYHGFKDFVETFYNNGFEGKHLVALTVGSFSGMRKYTTDRVIELIGAIQVLKRDGGWVRPDDDDDDSGGGGGGIGAGGLNPGATLIGPGGIPLSGAGSTATLPGATLPGAGESPQFCDSCYSRPPTVRCNGSCNKFYCDACSDRLHGHLVGAALLPHQLVPLGSNIKKNVMRRSMNFGSNPVSPPGGVGAPRTSMSLQTGASLSPPTNNAVRRLSSSASAGAGGHGVTASNGGSGRSRRGTTSSSGSSGAGVPATALPDDTEDKERARIGYFLTIDINREDCKKLLHPEDGLNGIYILRRSKTRQASYVLSMTCNFKVQHFQIQFERGMYVTQIGHSFRTLEDLVAHFKKQDKDGLPCRLVHACRHYDHVLPAPEEIGTDYEAITPTMKQMQDFRGLKNESTPKKKPYENHEIIEAQARDRASRSNSMW